MIIAKKPRVETLAKKIHHSSITVTDLEESLEFYKRVLGLEQEGKIEELSFDEEPAKGEFRGADLKLGFLKAGDNTLELIQYMDREGNDYDFNPWDLGVQHIAFVVEDIEKVQKNLEEEGVETLTKKPAEGVLDNYWLYFRDPDGSIVEVMEFY